MAREPNDNGRVPVVFRVRDGWGDKPVDLPCGKCVGCLQDKARGWAVRCFHESTQHLRNCFVTLTYNDEHCPGRLCKPDLQRFFKRLRARGVKLRYFACGEYGGKFGRPHYHALFFGQDFLDGSIQMGVKDGYYTHPLLDEVWGNGFVTIAPCEPASVFYVTGYTLKNLGQDDTFHLASKRPYIGHGWLAKYYSDISQNGFVTIDGRKLPVPRSYLDRPEFALEFDQLREERRQHIADMTPQDKWDRRAKMRAKEINLKAKVAL